MKEVWLEERAAGSSFTVCRFSRPLAVLVLRGRSPGAVALANLVLSDCPGHIVRELDCFPELPEQDC